MASRTSPNDPMFYLHHSMVDKAWWDWRESFPTASVSVLNSSMQTFNGYPVSTVNGQALVDSKSQGVWYAYDHQLKVVNYDFDSDQNFKYSTGDILIRNISQSGNNELKFRVKSGSAYSVTIEEDFELPAGNTLTITSF